jgi:RNA polymerase sigma-70 factor (ECF subfamily)
MDGDRRAPSRLPNELERELVARAAGRPPDTAAFVQLYDFYLPRIYGFIYRRVQERSVAEDLTATTFEKGLDAMRRGNFRNDSFGGWLYKVASNACVDHVRRNKRLMALDGTASGRPAWIDRSDEPATQEAWATALERDELQRALDQLPERHRRVLTLRYYDDLDPAEASAVLGVSPGTFAVRLHRALAALRGVLLNGQGVPGVPAQATEQTDVA